MAQEDYGVGEELPKANGKLFQGLRADLGTGASKFVAWAGTNLRTINGRLVADGRVQLGTEEGAGATIGAASDAAVASGPGTLSGKLRGALDWLAALGATGDAAVTTDATGTISAKLRGLVSHAAQAATDRGSLLTRFGATTDVPVTAGDAGTLHAKIRGIGQILVTLWSTLGDVADAAVITDANGTVQQYLRGLVKHAFERMPSSLGQKTMNGGLPVTIASDQSAIPASQSGTWNVTNVSGTVSLPTGAATAANQATGNTSLAAIDTKLSSLQTELAQKTEPTDTQPISAASLPLPTGASTAANQSTGNTSLASIDTKTPALGQALAAASVPVVLPAAQLTTLTPPAAITGFATEATLAAQSAKLPASLGQKAASASLSVVPATGHDGAYTTPTHTVATVTNATGAALGANANRLYALLVNDSDTTIYLKLGVAAAANQGIRLSANGGSYEMSKKAGNLYTGAINAIHAGSGSKALLVTEGV